ncbi:VOC family protein [Candidatus Woesebacteria bacterium]|nr:VOC family protein [Candidatus Woesebacteria bacterium]
MAQLTAYIGLNGQCREAMEFYKKCLGGELQIMTFGDSPLGKDMSSEMSNRIMHSALIKKDFLLMASDMSYDEGYKPGNNVSLCLVCSSEDEVQTLFKNLSEGGHVRHSLKKEFFGTYGDLTDKYGFNWMFQYSPENK